MIIFLYGPDTFRSRLKLKEIIASYRKVHQSGLNLKYFEGQHLTLKRIKDELRQTTMFKEKKLMVLNNVFSNSQFKKEFSKERKFLNNTEHILVFYEQEKTDKRSALFSFLKKKGKCQEFKALESPELRNWIKKQTEALGATIEQGALDKLINYVGNDLWQMMNEIRKLTSFKAHGTITSKDVELLVKAKVESDIFRTIDAIASKDKKRALKLLKDHLIGGDHPLYLFTMINFQFRNLLMVKDLEERGLPLFDLPLHPFVVKKSRQLCDKFEFSELKKIYQKIFEVDQKVKTGKITPEVALDLLIAEI
jgi:DNA polymerase-3 subunit delta